MTESRASAYHGTMANHQSTIQLGAFCAALRVRPRDVRYILEQGYVPAGVDAAPNSGTYRQFTPRQAFWLAMIAQLKEAGIPVPLAAQIAHYCEQSLRTVARNLGWDRVFAPDLGRLETGHRYVAEIADRQYIRIGSNAAPSAGGQMQFFDWHRLGRGRRPVNDLRPCVTLRLDLAEIARRLATAFGGTRG
ncbi:MAG: MerR family transcriptional regulator [Planctomycetota bacterium]